MKIEKTSLTLVALLILGILSALPVSTASEFEPPTGWMSWNPITFVEAAGINRVNETVDIFFYPSPNNCSSPNEIRVIAPDNVTEVPCQVYNVTYSGGYVESCNVVFQVNCNANSQVTYYIVYHRPGAPPPGPYATDLKVATRAGKPIIEIEAMINNSEYQTYVGREASLGHTATGDENYIWDYSSTLKIFRESGWIFGPAARTEGATYFFMNYAGASTFDSKRNGSIFVDIDGAAIWTGPAATAGLINITSKLRFFAYNEWFITTYSFYTTGEKTYDWLKPNMATDKVYITMVSFPNKTSGAIESYNVTQPPFGSGNFFTTDWNGTWIDFQNTTGPNNTHGFAVLQLPEDFPLARVEVTNATSFVGLMRTDYTSGPDECSMFWNGSGQVFTANMAVGWHANSNYTYAQELYNKLTNLLQSTLEVLTENGPPTPGFSLPSGWSTYTPINVTETIGKSRTLEPVDVFFRPGAGTCQSIDEIRVYTSNGVEIPCQVYNETIIPAGVESLNVVFLANVTANKEDTYYIIYNKLSPPKPSYPTDLSVQIRIKKVTPTYYTQDVANSYYNSTGDMEGALKEVKILGYSSTTTSMSSILVPVIRFSGEINIEDGWFGYWSYSGNTTLVNNGPVFADVEGIISDWGTAQGRPSGCYNTTIKVRFYAYTPWVTATITFNCNGTVNYELMTIGVHSNTTAMSLLTRPNAASVIETFSVTQKPGNVTRTPKSLAWCADWDKTWLDLQNTNASNNPVGTAVINLNGAGTTSFIGIRSEDGDEASPYWNGTCNTKTAKMAVGFHTNANYTYAKDLYTRLTNPLTYTIGEERSVPGVHDVAVTNVKAYCPKEGLDPITQGYNAWTDIKVNVTVQNPGDFEETFTVTANYGNTTGRYVIGTPSVVTLASKASRNITFTWNPTGVKKCVIYTISANVSVVAAEINTANNYLADGTVKIKFPGDASNDNFVDVDDLQILGWSWQKGKGDTGYNPQADFSFDAFVDVDDLQILGWNWQQGCP